MPDTMKQAIVAAENRTFWTDRGISIRGMIRAGWAIARGEDLQGGSTITQQYIKILYLNSERTLTRKFREIFLAYKLSKELTKEEILEGYLNTIYFGHGAYGVQAASRAYFDDHRQQAHRAAGRVPGPRSPGVQDSKELSKEEILNTSTPSTSATARTGCRPPAAPTSAPPPTSSPCPRPRSSPPWSTTPPRTTPTTRTTTSASWSATAT